MIREMKPLNMAEAKHIVETTNKDSEINLFLKKFTKIDRKKAEEMEKELKSLELIKLKEDHIVKIIDLIPEDASDIRKIFVDVDLDENEINKLLEVIKKYR